MTTKKFQSQFEEIPTAVPFALTCNARNDVSLVADSKVFCFRSPHWYLFVRGGFRNINLTEYLRHIYPWNAVGRGSKNEHVGEEKGHAGGGCCLCQVTASALEAEEN